MKKNILLIALVIALILALFTLTGCSNEKESINESKTPVGLYRLIYAGNSEGEYVEEYNVTTDFYGDPITLQEMMYEGCDPLYYSLNEDGTGFYFGMDGKIDVLVTETSITNHLGEAMPYTLKDGKIIVANDNNAEMFDVYEKTSKRIIDLILEGKGGSVPIDEAEIGDLVAIGTYDIIPNNEKNEALLWRVIDKKDGKLFVIADQLIDSFSFNYNPKRENVNDVTWENSSLRQFLNNEFISYQMTEEEAKMIVTTHNENKASNEYLKGIWNFDQAPYSEMATQNHRDDADTDDKIFLLSLDEVLKYFEGEQEPPDEEYPFNTLNTSKERTAYVTRAVRKNDKGYFNRITFGGTWMTRTLSDVDNKVVYISNDGQIYNYFTYVPLFIRPAMWIDPNNQ